MCSHYFAAEHKYRTTMTTRPATSFTSEGFDLDALGDGGATSSGDGGADVVYEIGGGATIQARDEPTAAAATAAADSSTTDADVDAPPDPLAKSEASKAEGNSSFKEGNYLDAHDYYTDAIEACPGEPTGEQLLKMREEFEEAEREKAAQRHREEMDRRREVDRKEAEKRRQRARARIGEQEGSDDSASDGDNTDDDDDDSGKQEEEDTGDASKPAVFQPPEHPHGSKLAIYHANRAACSLHLNRPADCVEDCTVAIMLNPKYVKAYLRRASAHEVLEQTEDALKDAKVALEIDPRNAAARREVARLQKIEDERLEKLKEETMGKLKDLGNSILGNFGLSLDNFNAVQDPNTGSYSISFNQNASGGGK